MSRTIISRFTDKTVKCKHPIDEDVDPRLPIVDANYPGATCVYNVFDISKDEVISVNELAGQTVLSVSNAGIFKVAETVLVTLDSGVIENKTIDLIDAANSTIRVTVAITANASAGNRVRSILGTQDVAMAEFGTPDIDKTEWGWRESLLKSHIAHSDSRSKTGFDIDIEITLDGGAGVSATETECVTIKEDDCD